MRAWPVAAVGFWDRGGLLILNGSGNTELPGLGFVEFDRRRVEDMMFVTRLVRA